MTCKICDYEKRIYCGCFDRGYEVGYHEGGNSGYDDGIKHSEKIYELIELVEEHDTAVAKKTADEIAEFVFRIFGRNWRK